MTARILVVDDILPNRKLLEAKLTAEYFDVLLASDGPTAIAIAKEQLPDLILLDVMMPGMDGFEVCRQLKECINTAHIPVVMVTALSDISDRVRGLEAGADDFLSKPVNDIALFARVRSLVRLKVLVDELRLRQASAGDSLLEPGADGIEAESANARVLVIESNEITAQKVIAYLQEAGHAVDWVGTASDSLRIGRQKDYDLIIAGLDIGGEDGLRVCSQLRSQEETRQVPILLLLDDFDLPQLAKGLELGVTDYLVKPIDRNELLARSRTQIRRRRYHDKLRGLLQSSIAMAYTDALTGLYNRRYMNTNLDRRIMEIAETAKPVSIMTFDIDHFKHINDNYGHAAGDEVLKAMAKRVSGCVREMDLVARYGGEEFVVMMPGAPLDIAWRVAERVASVVSAEPFSISTIEERLTVTVSIGVATTLDPMEEAGELLRRADKALYQAKDAGRNRVVMAEETCHGESALERAGPRALSA